MKHLYTRTRFLLTGLLFPLLLSAQPPLYDFVLANNKDRIFQPALIFNTNTNTFVAAWTFDTGSDYTWSPTTRKFQIGGGTFTQPQINAQSFSADQTCTYATSFDITSGTPSTVSPSWSAAYLPAVAPGNGCNLYVWEDFKGGSWVNRRVSFMITGKRDTSELFRSIAFKTNFGYAEKPSAGGNLSQFLVVAAAGRDKTTKIVAGKLFNNNGSVVSNDSLIIFESTTGPFESTDVDVKENGDFIVVAASGGLIYSRTVSAAGALGTIYTTTTGVTGSIDIANKLLVWSDLNGSVPVIKGIKVNNDGSFSGSAFQVDQTTGNGSGYPAVAYCPLTTNWLVAWHHSPLTGPATAIYGREYKSDGTLGSVYKISNQGRTAVTPSVAFDSYSGFRRFWIAFNGGGSDDQLLAQFWSTRNEQPLFTKGANQTCLEDANTVTVPSWATSISPGAVNEADQVLTFNVSTSSSTLFSEQPAISSAGTLTYKPAHNAVGTATVTVYLTDDGGTDYGGINQSTTKTFTITVNPVNDPPVGINSAITIWEDYTKIFAASDFGFSDPTDFHVNALKSVKIESVPSKGYLNYNGNRLYSYSVLPEISVADLPKLTYTPWSNESGSPYSSFYFRVRDDGGVLLGGVDLATASNTMTINVLPNNDPPVGSNISVTILEDHEYIFHAYDFYFDDPYDWPNHNTFASVKITTLPPSGSLSLSGVPVVAGASVPVASLLNLKFTPPGNANGSPYTSFTFQVQDDGGTANGGTDLDPTPNTVTVTVTSVNDEPAGGTNLTVTVAEDHIYTFAAADFGFTDPNDNPPNSLLSVKIGDSSHAEMLKLNSASVTKGQVIAVGDIPSLTFTPAAGAHGEPYAYLYFQVQDNGGTTFGGVDLDQTAKWLLIHVTSVNDAPSGADKTITILEDSYVTFAAEDFGFTDPDVYPANLLLAVKVTTLPGSGQLTLSGSPVTAGQSIAATSISSLRFTPAPNGNGIPYASFTFQVQDDGGTANGGIDLDPSANTFTVNVTGVNDPPAGTINTVTILEGNNYNFASADFGFSDPDDSPPNGLRAVKITALPAAGSLTLSSAAVTPGQFIQFADIGSLKFSPAANANGSPYTSFTFQVQDDGGTTNGGIDLDPSANTFTFNVTPVNDPPAGADKSVTILEDHDYIFAAADFGFSDPDDSPANGYRAVKITSLPAAGSLKLNSTSVTAGQVILVADFTDLKFSPAANASGSPYTSFTFQVQDDGGTANGGIDLDPSANTFTVNVSAVNDPPAGTSKTVTILEDHDYSFADIDFGFTDPDDSPGNGFRAVKISTLPSSGSLKLNSTSVTAGQVILVADITNLTFSPALNVPGSPYTSLTFRVQDDGETANEGIDLDPSANTFSFNVTPVNDPPGFVKGPDQSVYEDSPAQTIPGWAAGIDDGDPELTQILTFNVTNDNPDLFSVQPAVSADGTLVYTPYPEKFGVATVTVTLSDDGPGTPPDLSTGEPQNFLITVIKVNDPPVINNDRLSQSVQYSDPIIAVNITASDPDNSYNELTMTTSWKKSTDAGFTPGLPSDLKIILTEGDTYPKRWVLSGIMTMSPADYIIRATVSDGTSDPLTNSRSTDIEIIENKEDARITYTGALFVSTSGVNNSSALVNLAATIQDITAVTGDLSFDPDSGDIRKAQVTFKIIETGQQIGPLTPVLVSPTDLKTGTVQTNWPVNIGSSDSKQFTVAIILDGCYGRSSSEDDAIVTVSKPLVDFITGGGFLRLNSSAGLKAGDKGSRNHFGFNVKFNKKGTNLQGNINALVRRTESGKVRVYQIKGNSMTSLSVQGATLTTPSSAIFNGKASIQDFTDPLSPLSVDGNATLQVTMTDFGDPTNGKSYIPDRITITVWNKSGALWFASNWDGKQTIEQKLEAGNLKVNSSGSVLTGNTASAITLVSSKTTSIIGEDVTFTATVSGSLSALPTGTVTFFDYCRSVKTILGKVTLVNGKAILSTTSLIPGSHEIYAYYGGDSKFISGSAFLCQTVNSPVSLARPRAIEIIRETPDIKVYPNPFNKKLRFELFSPYTVKTRIDIFDITGQIVQTIMDQTVDAGIYYTVDFTPHSMVTGMYVYRITLGQEVITGKALYNP